MMYWWREYSVLIVWNSKLPCCAIELFVKGELQLRFVLDPFGISMVFGHETSKETKLTKWDSTVCVHVCACCVLCMNGELVHVCLCWLCILCLCVHIHVYLCLCAMYVFVRVYVCVWIYVLCVLYTLCVFVRVCVCVCMSVCLCVYVCNFMSYI